MNGDWAGIDVRSAVGGIMKELEERAEHEANAENYEALMAINFAEGIVAKYFPVFNFPITDEQSDEGKK